MSSNWVDYKSLREGLDVLHVLRHYRVELKRRGNQLTGFCPLPTHQSQRNTPSFSVSLVKRIFQCFGCGAKGNILDFAARMEGLDPRKADDFRKAALLVQQRFGLQSPSRNQRPSTLSRSPPPTPQAPPATPATPPVSSSPPRVLVNPPLDFELKNLDPKPQYLLLRGFSEVTLKQFGLGYCSKGMFAGRVVIPLHDAESRLIGYAGRLIFEDAVDTENPKYLFPARRERQGQVHEFAKSLLLYNGHRIQKPVHDLVVVQGFTDVWWLWQAGFPDTVGLMGATCSPEQAESICSLIARSGRVWILTDANHQGNQCAHSLFDQVGTRRFCKHVAMAKGQPAACSSEELQAMLEWTIDA